MGLYAAKLKANAKPVSDLPPVDKKEAAKLKRQEKALLKKQEKEKEQAELKRQQEEAQNALVQKEAELKQAEEALIIKKEAQKEKRRLKREAKKVKVDESVSESLPSTNSTETTLVPEPAETKTVKKTRKRKQVNIDEQVDKAVAELPTEKKDMEPPAWFKKYVTGVKNEESQHRSPKKAKRVIAKEANQVATEQWGNGLVRDRVRNEVDQHMSRMYQMIFNRGF